MKTAIIFTTKYGCTEKAAQMLKSKLGGVVDVYNLATVDTIRLDQYDTVILGGSIYIGKIQKQLTNFARTNLTTLSQKRIGLFICAGQPDAAIRAKELQDSFPPELFQHAFAKDVFGHWYNFEKMNFLDKLITKKIVGITASSCQLEEDKIEAFAHKFNH